MSLGSVDRHYVQFISHLNIPFVYYLYFTTYHMIYYYMYIAIPHQSREFICDFTFKFGSILYQTQIEILIMESWFKKRRFCL